MDKLIRVTTVPISLEKLLGDQMRFMSDHYKVIAVSSDRLKLSEVGSKEGVEVFTLEMSRQITPIADLKALWKLYNFLRKERPLIVHSHTPKAGVVSMIAARLAAVPIRLHTVAGLPLLETKGLKRLLLNFVEKITYNCATMVYPNSKGLSEIIMKNRFTTQEKVKVIGKGSSNGINTNHFDPECVQPSEIQALKHKLGINEGDFVFIYVGRMVRDKGINELLQSFDRLCDLQFYTGSSNETTVIPKLLLVGYLEQDLDPISPEANNILENNKNILFVGYQGDVRPFYCISDCLVFPSYREGFPNVVMQAGAMGLPSIVSNINGCNEIISEGVNGTIIPPKSVSALYFAMLKFIKNPTLLFALKSNARKIVVERYEQRVVWEALFAEYKRLEKHVQSRG